LSDARTDYIILDSDGSRIKINLDGYVLNKNNKPTSERVINTDQLQAEQLNRFATKTLDQEGTE